MDNVIVTAARQCLGTPFRHQGRINGVALDCIGVVIHVAKTIGAEHWEAHGYARNPANGLLEDALDRQPCLARVALEQMQAGDVLLMRFATEPQHVAIYTERDTIIHSYERVRMVCEHGLDAHWRARIVRVYRFKS